MPTPLLPYSSPAALLPCVHAQILEERPALYFHLQQQRLIELIRTGDAAGALTFAQVMRSMAGGGGQVHPATGLA